MEYCVIGAGAMGGLYGLSLINSGHSVTFLDINAEHVDAINKNGYRLSGVTGDKTHKVKATLDPNDLVGSADAVLFHTHTNGTAAGAKSAALVLKPDGWAISLQNGIGNIEELVKILGPRRVVGGISYHSAALSAPGHALHTNTGPTYIGELDGGSSDRVQELMNTMLSSGFEPEIVPDIMSVIWSKFVLNCGINPLCAVSGLRLGEVARNAAADQMQSLVLDEVMAVVKAKGVELTNNDMIAYIKKLTRLRYNKPSMQQHMEAGRPTEIDSLNGALVREAKLLGVKVPFNQALVLMVKAREAAMVEFTSGVSRDYAVLEAEAEAEEI
jgi:2-dehydropantoate 2-reductase